MTETPERIYAWVYDDGDRMHHKWSGTATYGALQTEYVRADLATSLNDPRVKALTDAANGVVNEYYNQVHGPVIYNIKNLDAALSALGHLARSGFTSEGLSDD
jgi:hypothetical protein